MLLKIKNINYSVAIVSVMFAVPTLVLAASSGSSNKEISWFLLVTSLFGGLGMFLYGMEMMSDGMKLTAGNKMRSILEIKPFFGCWRGCLCYDGYSEQQCNDCYACQFCELWTFKFCTGSWRNSWFKYRQYRHCTDCRVQGNRLCSGFDRNRGTDVSFFKEGFHQKPWFCYTRVWALVLWDEGHVRYDETAQVQPNF
mgnify:CR=1 FL=1